MKLRSLASLFSLSLVTLTASSSLVGCASADGDDVVELGAAEDELSIGPSNTGFFIVTHRDMRKCAAPMCGGFFVKRVNDETTRCADGTMQDECYVSSISLKGVGLTTREEDEVRGAVESGRALIKARTYKTRAFGRIIGTLKASEAWVGATGSTPDGTFYRAADNGMRCVTTPCPSTTASALNGGDDYDVIDVELEQTETPAEQEVLSRGQQDLGTEQGILVAGGVALPKCIPGSKCGPLLIASEFYVRVTRREGKSCGSLGSSFCNANQFCSWKAGDLCGAADAPGKCTYRPEVCTRIYAPVCGCDDRTYGNACEASASGVSIASNGECASN